MYLQNIILQYAVYSSKFSLMGILNIILGVLSNIYHRIFLIKHKKLAYIIEIPIFAKNKLKHGKYRNPKKNMRIR